MSSPPTAVASRSASTAHSWASSRAGCSTTVYKGTNLIKQELVAKTDVDSIAYKYEAGLKGLTVQPASRVAWRDTGGMWQEYRLGGTVNTNPVPLRANNRLVVAEAPGGSIAAFPPPHSFFWSRECRVRPLVRR